MFWQKNQDFQWNIDPQQPVVLRNDFVYEKERSGTIEHVILVLRQKPLK